MAEDEKIILERDTAEAWADKLAGLIASMTGFEIGEHSNINDPWERAAEAADAFLKMKR